MDRKSAIEYIKGQLEDGYVDIGCHDVDELEIIKEAMSALETLELMNHSSDEKNDNLAH